MCVCVCVWERRGRGEGSSSYRHLFSSVTARNSGIQHRLPHGLGIPRLHHPYGRSPAPCCFRLTLAVSARLYDSEASLLVYRCLRIVRSPSVEVRAYDLKGWRPGSIERASRDSNVSRERLCSIHTRQAAEGRLSLPLVGLPLRRRAAASSGAHSGSPAVRSERLVALHAGSQAVHSVKARVHLSRAAPR
eukprot:scaffold613_cov243-Pinguiococcus_pyrenoidosus.AAC.7